MPCRPFISVALFLLAVSTHAEDLGTIGPTYEITERDLIEVIKDKFRRMEKTGELARMQDDYKRQVVDAIEHPNQYQASPRHGPHGRTTSTRPGRSTAALSTRRGTSFSPPAPASIPSTSIA